jgi:hypothetical protein
MWIDGAKLMMIKGLISQGIYLNKASFDDIN